MMTTLQSTVLHSSPQRLLEEAEPLRAPALPPLHHLRVLPVTGRKLAVSSSFLNITVTVVDDRPRKGKFTAAVTALQDLPSEDLVVLSHLPDNKNGPRSSSLLHPRLRTFRQLIATKTAFVQSLLLLQEQAVVLSAAATATAGVHIPPGTYYDRSGRRSARAVCGDRTCPWDSRSDDTTAAATTTTTAVALYPDGTLMAGRVRHVLQLLQDLDIRGKEEERVVLVDYIQQQQQQQTTNSTAVVIVLDEDERFFGRQPQLQQREHPVDGCSSEENIHEYNERIPLEDARRRSEELPSVTSVPLFLQPIRSRLGRQCETNSSSSSSVTNWGLDKDIATHFDSISELIDERFLVERNETTSMIDVDTQPYLPRAILYTVSRTHGITSKGKQSYDDDYQSSIFPPMEKLYTRATELLLMEMNNGRGMNWPSLRKTIRKGSGFPFLAGFGDDDVGEVWCRKDGVRLGNASSSVGRATAGVPVFTTSARHNCQDTTTFPSPHHASVLHAKDDPVDWYHIFEQYDSEYPWSSKIRKIAWRGPLSESDTLHAGNAPSPSVRWRLCERVANATWNLADFFDVGFTEDNDTSKRLHASVDVTAAGGFKPPIEPVDAVQQFTAVLVLDGVSSRSDHLLCFNSVVLKVEYQDLDYFDNGLRPWKHYIPIKQDLSNLEDVARFVTDPQNDAILLDIVASANRWCSEHLLLDQLAYDQLNVWEQYVKSLYRGDQDWLSKWDRKQCQLDATDILDDDRRKKLVSAEVLTHLVDDESPSKVTKSEQIDWDAVDHVYYYHTRKAGGTTLRKWVRQAAWKHGKNFTSDEGPVFDHERFEANERVLLVTALRPPVDRIGDYMSVREFIENGNYYNTLRKPSFFDTEEHRQRGWIWRCAAECYSKWFGGWPTPGFVPNTERAVATLNKFEIIWMKNLQDPDYMNWLTHRFNVTGSIPHNRKTAKSKPKLTAEETELFERVNSNDVGLYSILREKWKHIVPSALTLI